MMGWRDWFGLLAPMPEVEVRRSAEHQAEVDRQTQKLELYQSVGCPYCVRVRRAIARLKLDIKLNDVIAESRHRDALIAGGGRRTVPCLLITEDAGAVRWMYESRDIIAYLESRFGGPHEDDC